MDAADDRSGPGRGGPKRGDRAMRATAGEPRFTRPRDGSRRWLWPAAGLAAALALAAGAWAWRGREGREASLVRAAYRATNREAARAALAKWLARDPHSAEAHLWKAHLAIADRRPGG